MRWWNGAFLLLLLKCRRAINRLHVTHTLITCTLWTWIFNLMNTETLKHNKSLILLCCSVNNPHHHPPTLHRLKNVLFICSHEMKNRHIFSDWNWDARSSTASSFTGINTQLSQPNHHTLAEWYNDCGRRWKHELCRAVVGGETLWW